MARILLCIYKQPIRNTKLSSATRDKTTYNSTQQLQQHDRGNITTNDHQLVYSPLGNLSKPHPSTKNFLPLCKYFTLPPSMQVTICMLPREIWLRWQSEKRRVPLLPRPEPCSLHSQAAQAIRLSFPYIYY